MATEGVTLGIVVKDELLEPECSLVVLEQEVREHESKPGASIKGEDDIDTDVGSDVVNIEKVDLNKVSLKKHKRSWNGCDGEVAKRKRFARVEVHGGPTDETPERPIVVKREVIDLEFVTCVDNGEMDVGRQDEKTVMAMNPRGGNCGVVSSTQEHLDPPNEPLDYKMGHTLSRSRTPANATSKSNSKNNVSCLFTTLVGHGIEDHFLATPDKQPHQCRTCGKTFTSSALMLSHMKGHSGLHEIFKCEMCGMGFKLKKALWSHMSSECYHRERHKCESCGKTYKHKRNLVQHVNYECVSARTHKCDTCSKMYKYKRDLVRHTKHECGRDERHDCESCGKTYKNRSNLLRHMKDECGRDEPHKCDSCDKMYKHRTDLMRHVKHVCGRDEPQSCELCSKHFKNRWNLLRHMKYECGRKSLHACETCGKTYRQRRNLTSHVKYKCGRLEPHKCESCGKTFNFINNLSRHKKQSCSPKE